MSFCISFSLGQSLLLQSANSGLHFQNVSSNSLFSYLLSFTCLTSIFFFNFYFCLKTTSYLDAYMVSFLKISNLLLYCSIFHLAVCDFSRLYIQSKFFLSLLYFTNAVFIYFCIRMIAKLTDLKQHTLLLSVSVGQMSECNLVGSSA